MGIFIFWFALSIAVSLFATVRRNRNGAGWLILALIISPLLAGIFLAILKELPPGQIPAYHVPPSASGGRLFRVAVFILVAVISVLMLNIIGHGHAGKTEKASSQFIGRSAP